MEGDSGACHLSTEMIGALRVLLAWLPQLEALSLEGYLLLSDGALSASGDVVPLSHRVDVVLSALRAAPHSLRELWLRGPKPRWLSCDRGAAAHCASQLAEQLVLEQQQQQRQDRLLLPPALRVMVEDARGSAIAESNRTLAAAGLAECFESWSRYRRGGGDDDESIDNSVHS